MNCCICNHKMISKVKNCKPIYECIGCKNKIDKIININDEGADNMNISFKYSLNQTVEINNGMFQGATGTVKEAKVSNEGNYYLVLFFINGKDFKCNFKESDLTAVSYKEVVFNYEDEQYYYMTGWLTDDTDEEGDTILVIDKETQNIMWKKQELINDESINIVLVEFLNELNKR
jgi:hypothetical protein